MGKEDIAGSTSETLIHQIRTSNEIETAMSRDRWLPLLKELMRRDTADDRTRFRHGAGGCAGCLGVLLFGTLMLSALLFDAHPDAIGLPWWAFGPPVLASFGLYAYNIKRETPLREVDLPGNRLAFIHDLLEGLPMGVGESDVAVQADLGNKTHDDKLSAFWTSRRGFGTFENTYNHRWLRLETTLGDGRKVTVDSIHEVHLTKVVQRSRDNRHPSMTFHVTTGTRISQAGKEVGKGETVTEFHWGGGPYPSHDPPLESGPIVEILRTHLSGSG